jgi:hypothetical protein
MLMAFFQANYLNVHSGGAVIAPWEILPGYSISEWIDAAIALNDVPNIRERIAAQKKVMEDARRRHPTYAKMHGLKPL